MPDQYTGSPLISPVADLSPVAAAGREVGKLFLQQFSDPETIDGAGGFFYTDLGLNVGQGGRYDYQRKGNHITGFMQLPQYRDVSNFNVGLFCQQAGLSLDEALQISGRFAHIWSSNAKPNQPYGLDTRTAELITTGYKVGASGIFGDAAGP